MDGQTDTARKPRRQKCRLKPSDGIFGYIQTATYSNPNRLGNQYERLFTYLPAFTNRYRFNRFP
uniref:Uncharacterized protein n=1 Tax=Neisseria meningitidis alpha275 TaxID=295996 RepID=C6SHX4_NEIME|nr:hypothetical protein predicted by Glimmer/Critica [Neisseria meningitidis alpha275]